MYVYAGYLEAAVSSNLLMYIYAMVVCLLLKDKEVLSSFSP